MSQFTLKLVPAALTFAGAIASQTHNANPSLLTPGGWGFQGQAGGDTEYYGDPSGGTASPRARLRAFGEPLRNSTLTLQVTDTQPNSVGAIYIGDMPDMRVLPGVGTLLVDIATSVSHPITSDASGDASVTLPISSTATLGMTIFSQSMTRRPVNGSLIYDFSPGVGVRIGEYVTKQHDASQLFGSLSVQGASTSFEGIQAYEYDLNAGGATMSADVGTIGASSDFTLGSTKIDSVMVFPIGELGASMTWAPDEMMTTPAHLQQKYSISYSSGGTSYGPFTVAGTVTATADDVDIAISALPATAHPLSGQSITIASSVRNQAADYHMQFDAMPLPTAGVPVTGADVDTMFAYFESQMAQALNQGFLQSGAFFNPEMPTFVNFLADEAHNLGVLTDGFATTAAEIQEAITSGEIALMDGWGKIIVSKLLAALGIKEGVKGFNEAFIDVFGDDLESLGKHIDEKEYKKAAGKLTKILKGLAGKEFRKKLGEKVGLKLAGKILAKIGAKCIPLIGWGYFAGSLIWAIAEQWLSPEA